MLLKYVGLNPVIVHGGGPDITSYMERLGMEVRFVEGCASPTRDRRGGEDGPARQGELRHRQPAQPARPAGGGALGRGRDAVRGRPHPNADQVGFVGEVERVDVDVLNHIAEDYIPVVASAGTDRDGQLLQRQRRRRRRQGRRGPARLQGDLPHRRRGWLADPDDPGSLVSRATVEEVAALGELGRHAAEARGLRRGDRRRRRSAHIIDGSKPHSLLLELFTDAGIGTMVAP